MIIETEFVNALTVMKREGNILSRLVRDMWDRGNLSVLTKKPQRATDTLISVVGHITADELRREMDRTSMANGFANRFMFACVKRARLLPHGGSLDFDAIGKLGERAKAALEVAREFDRIAMDMEARRDWEAIYPSLSREEPGLLGAVIARAEAQTVRLAMVYALLDGSNVIRRPHLKAAYAVWNYCEASTRYIFGNLLGDPIADEILRALRGAGPTGLDRTAIRDLFKRHASAELIGAALERLGKCSKAVSRSKSTGGRPTEIWIAT